MVRDLGPYGTASMKLPELHTYGRLVIYSATLIECVCLIQMGMRGEVAAAVTVLTGWLKDRIYIHTTDSK